MDVIATVNISNGDFGDWLEFFKSYEILRHKYVENEIITQISSSQAVVSFTIVDFDGLTDLSGSQLLRDGEDRLGISVEIKEKTE
ncbi:hypothetical protein [uncultured Planktomarina sp.]|jgi:hypothetical protein|uniref:hypothetical protein n=1 Tax=uncultured Planktomarina sp. TaxID=1538529 RepID=UPI0032611E22